MSVETRTKQLIKSLQDPDRALGVGIVGDTLVRKKRRHLTTECPDVSGWQEVRRKPRRDPRELAGRHGLQCPLPDEGHK